jgi:hypothetical protein
VCRWCSCSKSRYTGLVAGSLLPRGTNPGGGWKSGRMEGWAGYHDLSQIPKLKIRSRARPSSSSSGNLMSDLNKSGNKIVPAKLGASPARKLNTSRTRRRTRTISKFRSSGLYSCIVSRPPFHPFHLHHSELAMQTQQKTEKKQQSESVNDTRVEHEDVQLLAEVILFGTEEYIARF